MPLSDDQLRDVRTRVYNMFLETIQTLDHIEENVDWLFGENSTQIKKAINEYLDDFFRKTEISGEIHPEVKIFDTPRRDFQRTGLYGVQLNLKERQVREANTELRRGLRLGGRRFFRSPFKKWIDRINNFLGSLISAAGVGEAFKELKDCLRDELPDED